jgi:hypothetical protein
VIFNRPIPFQTAIESAAVKTALPTTLSAAQYRALGGQLLRGAQISAKVTSARFLDQVTGLATDLAAGKTDYATARVVLQQAREGLAEAAILDDQRLDLILRTQRELAQGYGQWVEGNDPDVIDAFPARELYRLEARDQERDWPARWRVAARTAGDTDALRVLDERGRMVALAASGLWQALGDGAGGFTDTLGNPFPPFAFRSGMWTRDIGRAETIELGLLAADQAAPVPAPAPALGDVLAQPIGVRSEQLQQAILDSFGDDVRFENGVLTQR